MGDAHSYLYDAENMSLRCRRGCAVRFSKLEFELEGASEDLGNFEMRRQGCARISLTQTPGWAG